MDTVEVAVAVLERDGKFFVPAGSRAGLLAENGSVPDANCNPEKQPWMLWIRKIREEPSPEVNGDNFS